MCFVESCYLEVTLLGLRLDNIGCVRYTLTINWIGVPVHAFSMCFL